MASCVSCITPVPEAASPSCRMLVGVMGVAWVPFQGEGIPALDFVKLTPSLDSAYISADMGLPTVLGQGIRPCAPNVACQVGWAHVLPGPGLVPLVWL